MITNVTLSSTSREIFGTKIRQQTKDSFLNLSDLQDAYDKVRFERGWAERRIERVISTEAFKERCFYLLDKQGLIVTPFGAFIESADNHGLIKTLKQAGAWKTTGARHTKTTACNPYIWIMIAMEMNPIFYAEAITWVTDDLIINRIEAGNFCKVLNMALSRLNPDGNQYMELAKALNFVIFNRHETGIRNSGTKEELKRLASLEEKMAFLIERGYVKTFDELLKELRLIYKENHQKLIKC